LATKRPYVVPQNFLPGLKFLTAETAPALFQFPNDMQPVEVEINRLNNQALVQYYESEWHQVTP
jgi:spermidine synthase